MSAGGRLQYRFDSKWLINIGCDIISVKINIVALRVDAPKPPRHGAQPAGLTASKVKVETPPPPELGKESVNVRRFHLF